MAKKYFSFGVGHQHLINGEVFDTNVLVEIEEEEGFTGRNIMFFVFGSRWSMEYDEKTEEMMRFFPRGVVKLRDVLIHLEGHF